MEERIKKYVDYVFDGAPDNDRTKRTKNMVVSEITEKYDKGISEGKTEEKAYADAYKDAGKPVTKVGINFNVENEANFTEWVIK